MSLNKTVIQEIKQNIGCPDNAKFLGYVIYLPLNQEFLVSFDCNELVEKRGYSMILDLAYIFSKYYQAFNESQNIEYESKICLLFEDSTGYYLTSQFQIPK